MNQFEWINSRPFCIVWFNYYLYFNLTPIRMLILCLGGFLLVKVIDNTQSKYVYIKV